MSKPSETIKSHPMYSESDYAYLTEKGYNENEIMTIWDRDHASGCDPVHHQPAFDLVGYLNNNNS